MNNDYQNSSHFIQGSVRTYGVATRLLAEVWEKVFREPMSLDETHPKARFEQAVANFSDEMDRKRGPELMDLLRKEEETSPTVTGLAGEIEDFRVDKTSIGASRDIDDVPPNLCMQMIRNAILDLSLSEGENTVDLQLWDVLRRAMYELAPVMGWISPPRIGANSNFPRLWQYVCEIEEASSGPSGLGIRVINTRGVVPEYPLSPGKLRVRVNKGTS